MRTRNLAALLFALLFATVFTGGCASTMEDASPDGRDDVALVDGKADNMFGACGSAQLLAMLNDATVGVETLQQHGVHTRAARHIIEHRNGEDGVAGTADDVVFETLFEVDAVPYVGAVAMQQLAAIAADLCVVEPPTQPAEVIFSPQPHAQSHLARVAELIDGAQRSVDIAMYSFSDAGITRAIERAVRRGVAVRLMFEPARAERNNPAGSKSDQMERAGVDVRYINKIMHHKFAIIDGPQDVSSQPLGGGVLITGSGNWSNSAGTRYDENTVITFDHAELNLAFQREFNLLWANSRDFDNGAELPFWETDTIEASDIPDDPAVSVAFTSSNFRTYESAAHGPTFSVVRGVNTVANAIVAEIEAAERSIWIASGHLRSRPISEALLAKHAENPELDIKVYLDAQEYVSETVHLNELRDREACLTEAGDSAAKIDACLDKSYHYSHDVEVAGIDLRFKFYAYRWHHSYAEQMHHKYMIIDGVKVLSGSYNYSDNAEHNTLENLVIYDASSFGSLVERYEENFLSIWETGVGKYGALMETVRFGDRIPLVFDAMALTREEVRQLKAAISSNCPAANSAAYRQEPQRHHTCPR